MALPIYMKIMRLIRKRYGMGGFQMRNQRRIFYVISFYHASVKQTHEDRAKQLVYPFLKEMQWRLFILAEMANTCKLVVYIQKTFKCQSMYNNFRFEYVMSVWRKEVLEYALDLQVSR